MFASPAVAANVVYQGVLNGTLEARDLATGDLLWSWRTDASKENKGWPLTADGRFNMPFLFTSPTGEGTIQGTGRQGSVGSIFSTPLVADGVVYFGSADGNLYALE